MFQLATPNYTLPIKRAIMTQPPSYANDLTSEGLEKTFITAAFLIQTFRKQGKGRPGWSTPFSNFLSTSCVGILVIYVSCEKCSDVIKVIAL